MKLKDLRDLLNKMGDRHDDDEVLVEVYRKGSMGGTPAVKVTSANTGFDWDSGRFIIHTENPVMVIPRNIKRDMQIDEIIS